LRQLSILNLFTGLKLVVSRFGCVVVLTSDRANHALARYIKFFRFDTLIAFCRPLDGEAIVSILDRVLGFL
jgi:hypothetical protein